MITLLETAMLSINQFLQILVIAIYSLAPKKKLKNKGKVYGVCAKIITRLTPSANPIQVHKIQIALLKAIFQKKVLVKPI